MLHCPAPHTVKQLPTRDTSAELAGVADQFARAYQQPPCVAQDGLLALLCIFGIAISLNPASSYLPTGVTNDRSLWMGCSLAAQVSADPAALLWEDPDR